ncbi:hypothetical protein [Curtobacterium sp. 260]|uniref:hypothetical protein n=1 Tax=Curtobacterium sp. 260 TaxID=2817748 RepID=UPI002786ADE1|nr:hypothetical protein [Curtobacterium sp. 260]MDP9737342.1 hypothetical protein [Curtobacterium sp. 260]
MPHPQQPPEQEPGEQQQPGERQQQPGEQQPGEHRLPAQQPDGFAERTAAAEALPLPERADAFAALHDDLRTRLESGQAPQGHSSGRAAGATQVWGSGRGDGGAGA